MKLSLIKKLTFFSTSLIIIITVMSSVGLYRTTKSDIERLEKNNLSYASNEIGQDIYNYLWNTKLELSMISSHEEMVDFLMSDEKQIQNQEILEDFYHHNVSEKYAAIYLMDNEGKTWVSTDESFVNKNYSFRQYFKIAQEKGFSHDISIGVTSGELGYYFANRIEDEKGNFLGVLAAKLKPDGLYEYLNFQNNAEHLNLMLVDNFGIVIYSIEDDKMYKSLQALDQKTKDIIRDQRRFAGLEIEALEYNNIFSFTQSNLKSGIFEAYDKYDQEEEILAASKVDYFGYTVILEEDKEVFSSLAQQSAQKFSFLVIFIGFFMSFLLYYFIHKFLSPLEDLHYAIESIEKGDLSQRVNIKSGDELEDIGDAFNKMSARLDKNIKNIEEKITERTKTLEELNKHMVGRELKMLELKRKLNKQKKSTKDEN